MYRINIQNDKKGVLLRQDRKLFHTNDLALLWTITNKNTLYTTIKRYKKAGVLIPIHKGFYSVVPLSQLNPYEVGIAYLHNYAYVSTEIILARKGVISQSIPVITLVSDVSKKFELNGVYYIVRRMQDRLLYNERGIVQKGQYREATLARAVADLLYFNPRYYFDNKGLVDWGEVRKIQKEVGFR